MSKELTETDLFIANQIIILAPKQVPFSIKDVARNILPNKPVTDLNAFEEIILNTYTSENYYENIEIYLREKKYINPVKEPYLTDFWALSETGEKVKDLGGILNYENHLKKKEFWNNVEAFPKRFWFPIAVFGYILGLLTPTIQKVIEKRMKLEAAQPVDTVLKKSDTSIRSKIYYNSQDR